MRTVPLTKTEYAYSPFNKKLNMYRVALALCMNYNPEQFLKSYFIPPVIDIIYMKQNLKKLCDVDKYKSFCQERGGSHGTGK